MAYSTREDINTISDNVDDNTAADNNTVVYKSLADAYSIDNNVIDNSNDNNVADNSADVSSLDNNVNDNLADDNTDNSTSAYDNNDTEKLVKLGRK